MSRLSGRAAAVLVPVWLALAACPRPVVADTAFANVLLDLPVESPAYEAGPGGLALVPFRTSGHFVHTVGEPRAAYFVLWRMALECETRLGGSLGYVDYDWAGKAPAYLDEGGDFWHYAHGTGSLSGAKCLTAGVYCARGSTYVYASPHSDPERSFTASSDVLRLFSVVAPAPPPPPPGDPGGA